MIRKISLAGIFPPIPTPFDARGEVEYDRLSENVRHWCATPVAGLLPLGSNGECPYLTDEEKVRVLETVRAAMPPGKLLLAGTGNESTYAAIKLVERAAEVGADAAMVITPSYFKSRMDGAALRRHFWEVADHSPIPVIIYNIPANTGVDISAETVLELARHPNIISLKDSSGNLVKLGEILRSAPPHFQVLAGAAGFLYAAMVLGAVGGIAALANVAPDLCCQLYEAAREGRHDQARELQLRLIPANNAVTSRFGVPGMKQALDWVGYYGGPPRSPLAPLDAAQQATLRGILVEAGILPA
ncbi:MAG TPA: dihydrodipicolinate synthase family protein [Anaerolineae bacterium]|nr:dihydrodipicolinate synthase family protein [Anaerolineae bacterium]